MVGCHFQLQFVKFSNESSPKAEQKEFPFDVWVQVLSSAQNINPTPWLFYSALKLGKKHTGKKGLFINCVMKQGSFLPPPPPFNTIMYNSGDVNSELQWGLEYRMRSDFEWFKVVLLFLSVPFSSPDCSWYLNVLKQLARQIVW